MLEIFACGALRERRHLRFADRVPWGRGVPSSHRDGRLATFVDVTKGSGTWLKWLRDQNRALVIVGGGGALAILSLFVVAASPAMSMNRSTAPAVSPGGTKLMPVESPRDAFS